MLRASIKKQYGKFCLNAKLEAGPGVTGILGASGCGKSTFLRCVAGIDKPDEGHIELDGVTLFDSERGINLPPQKRRVGYLFQSYALFPNMTVKKNILCGLRAEKDAARRQKALDEVVSLLRLEGLEGHRPAQLSGGQAQRVALARILVNRPALLMLDEPFAALDSHLRGHLQVEMQELLAQVGGTALMVTHSRNEAYNLCARLALMAGGAVLAQKPTKELFAQPDTVDGARMTGCKNITPAKKTGEYEVELPEWGLRLATARPVRDDVCAVGIRAHYFSPKAGQNRFAVRQTGEMEEPFEWILRFRYENQAEGSPDVWWRLAKDRRPAAMPEVLGVAPANVLLLYPPPKTEEFC